MNNVFDPTPLSHRRTHQQIFIECWLYPVYNIDAEEGAQPDSIPILGRVLDYIIKGHLMTSFLFDDNDNSDC